VKRIAFAAAVIMAAVLTGSQASAATSPPFPPSPPFPTVVATASRAGATAIPALVKINLPTTQGWNVPTGSYTMVTDTLNRPLANWPVELQKRDAGSTVWKVIGVGLTNVTGETGYGFTNGYSASYRWATAAMYFSDSGDTIAPRYSATVAVASGVQIKMMPPNTPVIPHGQDLWVTAQVGNVAFPMVTIQTQRVGTIGWVNGPQVLVRDGMATAPIKMLVPGTYNVRFMLATTPPFVVPLAYTGSTSNPFPVVVL
jgi:hypothetical protein